MKLRAFPLVVAAGLTLFGCSSKGDTVAKDTLEQGITDTLTKAVGQRPDKVECPGPIKAEAGQTMRCVLTAGSTRYGLSATITSYENGTAHYRAQVDQQPMR
ncbi:DUF4333 domain-containing protein [Amycolatopsis sp. K13G38]|uniref:DUF4333 domain-containing protein n=1 Tax=Amycolatopsis acididurans TaxID=2724524 RepID=A0ABX1JCW6_9PSEU|nr:DUF4333 domain-containing protein [Amycolatopsis acididurans]NKQ56465.1 DUF4333 domain-containing protein [Amycolatopsis acididurans]